MFVLANLLSPSSSMAISDLEFAAVSCDGEEDDRTCCIQQKLFFVSAEGNEDLASFGAVVGAMLETSCLLLRNIMNAVVQHGDGPSDPAGAASAAAADGAGGRVDKQASSSAKEDAQAILEAVYRSQLVVKLVEGCRNYGANLSGKCVAALVHILSELVLSSSKFLAQFMEAGGLDAIDDLSFDIFMGDADSAAAEATAGVTALTGGNAADEAAYRNDALVSALQISSQLARHSEKFHNVLAKVFTPLKLIRILSSHNSVAKAKACNLVGNLCRYVHDCIFRQ